MGHFIATLAYRVLAASTLGYVMQLLPLRTDWETLQEKELRRMVRGPFAWVPAPWLTRSQWVVPLPSRFVHLQLLHQATALKTSRRWLAAA